MSTSLSGLTTNFFPSAQNGFTTTLASTIASGATTVPLNSVAGYSNGQIAVFVIDPSSSTAKQTFTGVVDTSGVQITSVAWTAGTNQTHTGGATVVDYASATHISMVSKGITKQHTQAGAHTGITTDTVVASGNITAANFIQTGGAAANGWTAGLTAPTTVTALGNRSYSCVFNGTDLTGTLSAGMRLRTTRTVAAPTQCTSLNGTTQYYSKTSPAGMTFTNNFVASAWVKLSSYNAATNSIISRVDATQGFSFDIDSSGRVKLVGYNGGGANFSQVLSYQSIPLNKWVHVAAQLDMLTFTATTTTSYVMIDGLDVPAAVSRGGTNPTALVQAGNLNIGASNSLNFFTGKIAQVAIYSAKVTQATILASMHQGLAGTETSLISAYSFNNSINDLNANANNLTANGSALATNADSPFGGQADGTISSTLDYAIITKTAFSTNTTLTVQVPEGCTIPTSGGVSAVSYSTQKVPYLFPGQTDKWRVTSYILTGTSGALLTGATGVITGFKLNVPIGAFNLGYQFIMQQNPVSGNLANGTFSLSTSTSSITDTDISSNLSFNSAAAIGSFSTTSSRVKGVVLAVATDYNAVSTNVLGVTATSLISNSTGFSLIYADCAHL